MFSILKQEELKELVLVTSEKLSIKYPSIIEKDYHVTQVIHALAEIENEFFDLVFSGGTCLAKAHQIVKRMSEDIDFKIRFKFQKDELSKTRFLKELKTFRLQLMNSLSFPGMGIKDSAVRNEGRYSRVELSYPALFTDNELLRPHLLLEFTLSDIRLPTSSLGVKTIIEEAIGINQLSPTFFINCISVDETAVEKWVALTRRVSAIERGYHYDDQTLIRHLYDLNQIDKASKMSDLFFQFVQTIIENDAKQFKNQHPEYFADPHTEIKQSLQLLKNKAIWRERYKNFIESMVYDRSNVSEYDLAIKSIERMSRAGSFI